jgi:hypothetical protein
LILIYSLYRKNDSWNVIVQASEFPRLHSFALDSQISVQEVVSCSDRATLFYMPLSHQAFEEFNSLELLVSSGTGSYQEKQVGDNLEGWYLFGKIVLH